MNESKHIIFLHNEPELYQNEILIGMSYFQQIIPKKKKAVYIWKKYPFSFTYNQILLYASHLKWTP
jgi:hypothetical protein